MHPLNDHAWQSDTRGLFFLFMDSQGTVNGTFYDGQVFFRAKLQLVADPLTLCTFFPHKFRVEVVFQLFRNFDITVRTNCKCLTTLSQHNSVPFIICFD